MRYQDMHVWLNQVRHDDRQQIKYKSVANFSQWMTNSLLSKHVWICRLNCNRAQKGQGRRLVWIPWVRIRMSDSGFQSGGKSENEVKTLSRIGYDIDKEYKCWNFQCLEVSRVRLVWNS